MDLVVARVERTTILDVSRLSEDIRAGQIARHDGLAVIGSTTETIILTQAVQEGAAIRCERLAQANRDGREVGLPGGRDTGLPSLEAIDVSRRICELLVATWFAAVFDIDAEDDPFRTLAAATAIGPASHPANTAEDNGIGWGRSRLRPANAVVRIADDELLTRRGEGTVLANFRRTAAEASAQECVVVALRRLRVEVNVDLVNRIAAAFVVTMMRPLAADARIAQRARVAILVAERS